MEGGFAASTSSPSSGAARLEGRSYTSGRGSQREKDQRGRSGAPGQGVARAAKARLVQPSRAARLRNAPSETPNRPATVRADRPDSQAPRIRLQAAGLTVT